MTGDDDCEYSYTDTRFGPDGDWKGQSAPKRTNAQLSSDDDIITNENAAYSLSKQANFKPATAAAATPSTTSATAQNPRTERVQISTEPQSDYTSNAYTDPPDMKLETVGKNRVTALAQGFESKMQLNSSETKKDAKSTSASNVVK